MNIRQHFEQTPVIMLLSSTIFAIILLVPTDYVHAGDDGVGDYSYYPPWTFQMGSYNRLQNMARPGRVAPVGPQPPFILHGSKNLVAHCAERPANAYCTNDPDYPTDLIQSCLDTEPDMFKKLRVEVQWSCPSFPDEQVEQPLPEDPPTEAPFEPETEEVTPAPLRQRPRTTIPAPRNLRARERLQAAASPVLSRRARDDNSGRFDHSNLFLPMQAQNQTFDVCLSIIRSEVGIVRAETETGAWRPVVQVADCKQVVRTEECLRPEEPCRYLCSSLKSKCTQRFAVQRLLTCSADRGLHFDNFRIPVSCGCQVEFDPVKNPQSTTPDPNSD